MPRIIVTPLALIEDTIRKDAPSHLLTLLGPDYMIPQHSSFEVDRHLRDLRASKTLPGVDAIRLPGEERRRRKAARQRDGLSFPAPLIAQLDALAADLGIAPLGQR